jgi:hypothetical protein
MRNQNYAIAACILTVGAYLSTAAYATQANDEIFANSALRSLHDLARAVARYQQATKDSDQFGCRDEYVSIQKIAHEALTDMHSMSFAPIDAIEDVSAVLRVSQLQQNGCSAPGDLATSMLLLPAGQAIIALRYDFSIGDGDWYPTTQGINAKNPLQYSQSLKDQNYSWVNVRPKDMHFIVESDWKSELASHDVADSSIENSGGNHVWQVFKRPRGRR